MKTEAPMAHPPIATREEWLAARLELLAEEKAHTREYDRINAKRRRLPMVRVDKEYAFEGVEGMRTLLDLFEDKTQLIVYHFMFGPDWQTGCPGCTSYVDSIGDLTLLGERNTRMVLASRATLDKLEAYRKQRGWTLPWYSTGASEFNFDFGVSADPAHGPMSYNYKPAMAPEKSDEFPGTSIFFRVGADVFHTYSTFQRGGEALCDSYRLLDITPYGRQEDFEDSPPGWPQKPTYG